MPEIPDKEIFEMKKTLVNGSVGFLCNLRNVVQWTFINPQGSGLVIINFILLDIYLHLFLIFFALLLILLQFSIQNLFRGLHF